MVQLAELIDIVEIRDMETLHVLPTNVCSVVHISSVNGPSRMRLLFPTADDSESALRSSRSFLVLLDECHEPYESLSRLTNLLLILTILS